MVKKKRTPSLIRLGMRPCCAHPSLAVLVQGRSHVVCHGVPCQDHARGRLDKILDQVAFLVKNPAVDDGAARVRAGAEAPVGLNHGVTVVGDLRARLPALAIDLGALGEQGQAGAVAGEVGAEAEAEVAATVGDEVADILGNRLEFFPGAFHICKNTGGGAKISYQAQQCHQRQYVETSSFRCGNDPQTPLSWRCGPFCTVQIMQLGLHSGRDVEGVLSIAFFEKKKKEAFARMGRTTERDIPGPPGKAMSCTVLRLAAVMFLGPTYWTSK